MKRLPIVLTSVLFVALCVASVWMGISLVRMLKGAGPVQRSTSTILQQVQAVSQLITVKYVMEKVVVLEDAKWYGENRVLLVAHGIVKAGVDLGKLKAGDVDVAGEKITLRIPRPQIMDCFLDEKKTYVIERSTGLLRSFDKDLEQTARQNAVDDIQRAARVGGILNDANERARWQLMFLFQQMGFKQVEFVQD
jgi:Protein of unknown function (DUF4230)